MAKIKIIKEMKSTDFTFTGDTLDLDKVAKNAESNKSVAKKDDAKEREYRLRADVKLNKVKHKSRMIGGHGKQAHSPIYE